MDDRWTLICSAQKNPFPLLPKLIKSPQSFLWQRARCSLWIWGCLLAYLRHSYGSAIHLLLGGNSTRPDCLPCVVGFSWECHLLWTLSSLENPLWIPEFLLFMKWKGGYYLGLSSYFTWSMWYEPSLGYFLAMELHSNNRWCCTLL